MTPGPVEALERKRASTQLLNQESGLDHGCQTCSPQRVKAQPAGIFFFLLNVKIAEKEGIMFDLFHEFCTRKHCMSLRIDRVLNRDLKR